MKKNMKHYVIIGLIIIGVGLGVAFIFHWVLEALSNIEFSETFNGGTIGGFVDNKIHTSFQGERFWKQKGEYKNKQGNTTLGTLEWYDGGDVYIGDHVFSRVLEGDGDWIDSAGHHHKRDITDAQVFYHSKGLHNENFELLSGEKIEKDDALGVWIYSKGIFKDGKFEATESYRYIINEDCSRNGLEPICFQGVYDAVEYNREKIGERCFRGHSCGLGTHIIEHLYSYEKLE